MQKLEQLASKVPEVDVDYRSLLPNGLSGIYFDYKIKLSHENDYYKNIEVLAEEIGHYYTSDGNITNYKNINSMRQEVKARRFGVKLALPLESLIDCYEKGMWGDICSMCMHLEISVKYFENAVESYKEQFGSYVKYDGYLIEFEPLNIKEAHL